MVLLARGWEVATQDVKHALLGIGYGHAYLTVQDISPGNEYGNFHSLFVTIFAEAGIVAGLFVAWLFVHVLLRAGPYWPLIAAFIAFREEVVTRRTKFLLNKARDRAHVLVGLAIAVGNIDEVIGLRLGLIPLTSPIGEFEPGDTVALSPDVSGPATAYSGDIESADGMVEPADTNIPIIELKEDQRPAFEAEAVLGYGRDHAKHQGGVSVGYRHLQTIEVGDELDDYEERDPLIVRGVIEEDGELIPAEEFGNDLTNRYPDREVEVHDVEDAFVFHVETDGSFPVDDLVTAAVTSVHDRADELEQAVQL
jgi:DNA-directed RNA polymerase subunit D